MAIDYSTATTTVTALSNLVLAIPQKQRGYEIQDIDGNLTGKALLFDYESENTASLESDITDHFVEDNTSLNDHIALRPEIISVRGFKGELSNIVPDTEGGVIRAIKDKLVGVAAYTPELTIQALDAYNTAFQLYQIGRSVERSVASWKTINKSTLNEISSDGLVREIEVLTQTKQAVAFQQFYGYWRNRTLFTIQTPWAIFKNCAIRSLRAVQDENAYMTDFEITFKMLRFADVKYDPSGINPNAASEITKNQGLKEINSGSVPTTTAAENVNSFFGLGAL